jgi:transcriptional regulator with GAF, ATPase, and Fis domain
LNPRLTAVAGPLAGAVFPLGDAAVTVGRHGESGLQIRDLAVSRRHCVLTPEGGRYVLRDLDSRHGTFVNGTPIHERILDPGDVVQIGTAIFVFEDAAGGAQEGEGVGERSGALLDDGDFQAESTVGRAERDLAALLAASADLQEQAAAEPLARRLLDLVFAISPAERAALLLLDRGGEPEASFACDRRGRTDPFPVSRTLLTQAVRERVGILAADVLRMPEIGAAASIEAARLRSLLALPLAGPEGVLGLLYADPREAGPRFDAGHLALLAAAARTAAQALGRLRRMEWLEAERRRLAAAQAPGMVGESPRMQELLRRLARVAPTGSTVLLRGESGTGKELAARALHEGSPRAGRPFVAINCATLSETLLESELFGHEKGAFTGAVERKAGKLELADSGTVFLDEVAELPPGVQAKLLRVLETLEFERVGGTRPIRIDVRLIAATHRDLESAIRDGSFRADLFYRLSVITLALPPLRDRREDIPLLASAFAAQISRERERPVAGFSPAARACLERYAWPGNVRELRNAVEHAVVLGEGEMIVPEDLPQTVLDATAAGEGSSGARPPRFQAAIVELKRRLILDAVREAQGSIPRAAESLGLHPNYLHRLITQLDLRSEIQS